MNNDGGPAFPVGERMGYAKGMDGIYQQVLLGASAGMTLRDYFAAAALQGICANRQSWEVPVESLAYYAWQQADAMLAARDAKSVRQVPNDPADDAANLAAEGT